MLNRHIPWEDEKGEGEILRTQIAELLAQDGSNPKNPESRKKICAEMNVLSRLDVQSEDRVVLLPSDNVQGRICAEMLKQAIIDAFGVPAAAVELRRIVGLQVMNAKKLREEGLKNLVKILLDYLDNDEYRYSYDIVLNPTGGFKGVVPFVTILGMLYGKRSVYLFEFAEELITLPPLPFSFDMHLYHRVRPALDFIDREIAVTEEAFLAKVINYVPEERDRFMSFTEPFDECTITLSPLAYCLLKIEKTDATPMIAESALETLKKVQGEAALRLKRTILKSVNPLWREKHYHTCYTSDLIVLKQGSTAERVVGFLREKQFLITNIFDNHNDYNANIGMCQRKFFESARFVPYVEEEYLGVDGDDPEAVEQERDKLLLENRELKKKLREAEKELAALKSKAEASS
jgi:putative CRISPR-associated protein (TIGR02619 family)